MMAAPDAAPTPPKMRRAESAPPASGLNDSAFTPGSLTRSATSLPDTLQLLQAATASDSAPDDLLDPTCVLDALR